MSRFVRASKYRHVFGQPAKKEHGIDNLKVTSSAWDTNVVSASGTYISVNWNSSGGGAFAILPAPSPSTGAPGIPSKLPDYRPTRAEPHRAGAGHGLVASLGLDRRVRGRGRQRDDMAGRRIRVRGLERGRLGTRATLRPCSAIDASPRKVGQVLWHPAAQHVLASALGDHTVKLWDLGAPESPRAVLQGHGDTIQSIAFSPTGQLLATTSRDRKLRLFDPRAGGDAVRVGEGHGGIKGATSRVVGRPRSASRRLGSAAMSDRQVCVWETGALKNVRTLTLDQSAGVVMPFWSDNNILFLAGKGDGNIRYYEYENDNLYALDEHKSSDPQRGMCFIPRRALNTSDCEIARAYKLTISGVEPIAFIVPAQVRFVPVRHLPARAINRALPHRRRVLLRQAHLPQARLPRDRRSSLPQRRLPPPSQRAPRPRPPQRQHPHPYHRQQRSPRQLAPPITKVASEPTPFSPSALSPPATDPQPFSPQLPPSRSTSSTYVPDDSKAAAGAALQQDNDRLNAELREARALIRNLELQVESLKANARKATCSAAGQLDDDDYDRGGLHMAIGEVCIN
ncbi:microtubule binding protein [Lactarius indigo]|nr:microtubule binding protein [Lactarius indigo]